MTGVSDVGGPYLAAPRAASWQPLDEPSAVGRVEDVAAAQLSIYGDDGRVLRSRARPRVQSRGSQLSVGPTLHHPGRL